MIRSIRRAVMLGTAVVAASLGAQVASATDFLFLNSNASAGAGTSLNYSSSDGSGLALSAYGGHLSNNSGAMATTTGATVATYDGYGMGVLSGSDTTSNGTHQIDNAGGGVDYVALVFNQAVTLSQLAVQAYGGGGVGTGVDAQFRTYSGSVGDLFSGSNLWEGYFGNTTSSATYSRGNTGSYVVDQTGATAASNIWLVAANVTQTNDAFKLLGVSVSKPSVGSVPEPASWALMIVGFGAVGSSMRRRRNTALLTA
jgi:hypothetical protein